MRTDEFENDPLKVKHISDEFNKNMLKIDKLKKKFEIKRSRFNEKTENKIFKLKFKKITVEIDKLISIDKNNEALALLTDFLDKNKDKSIVVTFYAKEKKKILKSIEKNKSKK
jgi:hypothetical protein